MYSRLFLQIITVFLCLIPICTGISGLIYGPEFLSHAVNTDAQLDSHFRYLSGLLLGIGLGFLSCVPRIERRGSRVRVLTFIVFVGGLARLLGATLNGLPDGPMQGALAMELVITPLLCWWQSKIAVPRRTTIVSKNL